MKKELAILSGGKPSKPGRPKINLRAAPIKETIEEVLFWISSGETLRSYCRQEGKPCYATIYSWMNIENNDDSIEFSKRFAHARERGAEMIAESLKEMMEEPPRMIPGDQPRIDPGWVQLQKAKADVTLKLLSKWSSRYSDKVQADVQGDIKLVINTGVPE